MALFCQNMIELSVEIAAVDRSFTDMVLKFVEHFWIASGMNHTGPGGMWGEADGFYYDVLRLPDGSARRLKVRSMVGLLPLCATTVIEEWQRETVRSLAEAWVTRMETLSRYHLEHPYEFDVGGQAFRVGYLPPSPILACSAAIPTGAARSGCR